MSIVRIKHNRENPFVQVNKAALWDVNLSLEAVGLWTRCLSMPDNWEFRIGHIAESCGISKKKIYKIIKELINAGYAVRIQLTKQENKKRPLFDKVHYVFCEFKVDEKERLKIIEDFKKSFPLSHFGVRTNELNPKGTTTNIDPKENEREGNKEERPPNPQKGERSFSSKKSYEEIRKEQIMKESNEKINMQFITKFQIIYSELIIKERVYLAGSYVIFHEVPEAKFKYTDTPAAFREQVCSTLRKMGIVPAL